MSVSANGIQSLDESPDGFTGEVVAPDPVSNRAIKYDCTRCGRKLTKAELVAKRVQFRDLGESGRTLKSRVTEWLCRVPQDDGSPSCLHADEDWNRPAFRQSPGMADTKMARIGEDN